MNIILSLLLGLLALAGLGQWYEKRKENKRFGGYVIPNTANTSTNLTAISGTAITLGQKASAASLPVVIASDQGVLGTVTGNVANHAADSGNPVKVGGVYNAVAPSLDSGDRGDIELDSMGNQQINSYTKIAGEDLTNDVEASVLKPMAISTYSWSVFQNLGADITKNVKASAGNVFSVYCHNVSGSVRYFQLHNTATTPGGAAVPAQTFFVPIGGTLILDGQYFGQNGMNFATGIAFACSTTEATYTAATATDHITQVNYI